MFRRSGYRFADMNMRHTMIPSACPDSEGTGYALEERIAAMKRRDRVPERAVQPAPSTPSRGVAAAARLGRPAQVLAVGEAIDVDVAVAEAGVERLGADAAVAAAVSVLVDVNVAGDHDRAVDAGLLRRRLAAGQRGRGAERRGQRERRSQDEEFRHRRLLFDSP